LDCLGTTLGFQSENIIFIKIVFCSQVNPGLIMNNIPPPMKAGVEMGTMMVYVTETESMLGRFRDFGSRWKDWRGR
jgi:hypothetical protein